MTKKEVEFKNIDYAKVKELAQLGKELDPEYVRYIAKKVYGKDDYAEKLVDALHTTKSAVYQAFSGIKPYALYRINEHLLEKLKEINIDVKESVNIQPR